MSEPRRRRRATSGPQRVGSEEGLTSSRPGPDGEAAAELGKTEASDGVEASRQAEDAKRAEVPRKVGGRHRGAAVEQTKDDTDEGWGERGDDDASARWLEENRPPHW